MSAAASEPRPMLALLIRLGAIGALATMAAIIKYLAESGVHLVEILFWRQALAIPMVVAWVWISTRSLASLRTTRPRAHALRGIYGLTGMILNFGGVILLPLAEATTMGFTAPIWAVILSMLLLKDKVGAWRWSAVLLGFAGILVIAQPGSGHIPPLGAAVALGGAFMIALISIQIADLGRTEQPLTIVFWFAMVSAPLCALGLPFVMQAHTTEQWLLLGALGAAGTLGQFLLTASLRYGKVASVIVMDYSSLFWATLYGWLIWQQLPGPWTWIGAPLIVAAGIIITWREHRLARRRFVDQRQVGT
jgi:drug/metabolite transporter (DMT)-like permease